LYRRKLFLGKLQMDGFETTRGKYKLKNRPGGKNEELPRRTQGNRHKEECTPMDRGKRVTGVNTGGTKLSMNLEYLK
jgi:hypothetical protein